MSKLSEAFDYVFDKEREQFSPDWTSPVGDTVKDILEERGEDYHDFIFTVADRTGWGDSPQTIKDIFDGKEEMYFDVANYLSAELGSTAGFWMRRAALYRLKLEDDCDTVKTLDSKVLERILSQCLSAQVKMLDVPYSASSHLNFAIAALSKLILDYNPDDEEMRQALEWAISEGKILRGEEE
jgi:plasmid maintenance system antidote protein VapI